MTFGFIAGEHAAQAARDGRQNRQNADIAVTEAGLMARETGRMD
jgi:hypothetical protein